MADHLRKQIRSAAAAALTGLATTGTRVFTSRARAIAEGDLPCLRVFFDDESVTHVTLGPGRRRERMGALLVEAIAKGNSAPEDTADQIVKEVEIALDANNGLGGLVKYIEPRRINSDFAGEADSIVVTTRMQFDVLYYAAMGSPDVAL